MRILVAIAPRSYRESVALALQGERPHSEVLIAAPGALDGQLDGARFDLIVCNEVTARVEAEATCWVEILLHEGLDANVYADGHLSVINDLGMDDLLTIIDSCSAAS